MRSTSEPVWRMIRLAVTVALVSACRATEYEYLGWKSDTYNGGRSYGKPPQCVDIPDDMRLCHNNCHPGTQVLLCSLFAPVCLERPIYPCRWLCEAVRDSCTPIMEAFGFPWPEMLTCDKFPQDDVCIAMTHPNATEATKPTGYSPICPPCDNEMKTDAMLEHMCASEFAFKTKIKEVKRENMDRKVILQKKKKMLKAGSLKKKDMKKLVLYLKNGADCPCQQLDNLGNQYLIMGRKVDKQYLLTGIHKWDKSSKEFKKAIKKLKTHKCPAFENVFK
eukprot:superscaffoldBa00002161_g13395